jgi:nucleoside-diphosphate-sugar epimerase
MQELLRFDLGGLVGVSIDAVWEPLPGVRHRRLDIRDRAALTALMREVAPDVVFHLAAQRDPGLAEHAVGVTVATNVLGTANVVAACEAAGVARLVYASTGKALRPYTNCVYASSKRISERIVGDAAARGAMQCSAVRFTHVVDNAILLQRLRRWCEEGDVIRLHSLDTVFYVQSARESAQLLLAAAVTPGDGIFRLHAIRDLGWPVNVTDLALGAVEESGRAVPIQEIGHEPGYEREPYPGLYDPERSGAVSPLLNAMEAPSVERSSSPDVDAARHALRLTSDLSERIEAIGELASGATSPEDLRARFDELAWADLEQTVRDSRPDVLRLIARVTAPHRPEMIDEHRRIDDAIRARLSECA